MPRASTTDQKIRLQKILAERGLCSRREADQWIQDGRVKVNGVVAEPGARADPVADRIVVNGKGLAPAAPAENLTLILNKPKGLICSHRDPFHQDTIYNLLPRRLQRKRLICAGRLDKNSEGMVILTSDGDLSHRIMHPSNGVVKRYRVTLSRPLPPEIVPKLLKGKMVEGEWLKAEKVIPMRRGPEPSTQLEVHLLHGKKREIRRLFEAFGFFVKRLKRFQMGRLVLRGMPPGAFRPLSPSEIESLFS